MRYVKHNVEYFDNVDNVDDVDNVDNVDNVLSHFWGNLKQYQAMIDKILKALITHPLSNIISRDATVAPKNIGSIFSN